MELLLLLGWALPLLELLRRRLLILLLLGTLQDLRASVLARETRWHSRWHALHRRHTWKRWLALIERLLMLLLRELLWVAHTWRRLDRRCASSLVSNALPSHHSLDLVHAHDLSRGARGLGGAAGVRSWRLLVLRLLLALNSRLFGLEAPDIGARLQLRDVLGVFVALIAGSVGLRGRLAVLLLRLILLLLRLLLLLLLLRSRSGEALTGLVQHLFLLDRARDL